MKKVDTVLTHLLSQPVYAVLKQQKCFRLIKKALPATLQRGVLFIYVKNKTLFFALKHPAYKMEFDYKLSIIKNLLTTLPPIQEACSEYEIQHVKTFVSKFAAKPKEAKDTVPYFKERASGDFEIKCKNKALGKEFEALKKTIRCSRH